MMKFNGVESYFVLLFWTLFSYGVSYGNHIKGLDDSILFRLNWPGPDEDLLKSSDYEKLEMITVNNEKFQCLVPVNYGELPENEEKYTGPNPVQLLMPLFKKKICSLRLEAFWTYELCHGQWMKQYHEGREESGQRFQDYLLGETNLENLEKLSREWDESLKSNPRPEIPHTKLEGMSIPYFSITYGGGSLCDLTGRPRVTKVLYVCYEEGRHSLFSIKETFTCEYEVVVLSSFLCQHPDYRPQEVPQTNLHCIPMTHPEQGRKRPKDLLSIEAESLKLRTHGTLLGGDISRGSVRLEVVEDGEEDDQEHLKHPPVANTASKESAKLSPFAPTPSVDATLVEEFLKGEYCLQGGSGWWKFEFCHGKVVQQYHEDRDGSKSTVVLGHFEFNSHKKWIEEHPGKRFKEGKMQVSHYYSGGDYCDAAAKKRTVEVRLKCKETLSQSAVTLYLLEPKTCEYILGVETPLVCPLLRVTDEYGLFVPKPKQQDSNEGGGVQTEGEERVLQEENHTPDSDGIGSQHINE